MEEAQSDDPKSLYHSSVTHTDSVREGVDGAFFSLQPYTRSMALGKGNKASVIHRGSESGPTAWTSQEFKGEGFRLFRPKDLTMACR